MKHITRERAERLTYWQAHQWPLSDRQARDLSTYHAWRSRRYRWAASVVLAAVFVVVVTVGLVTR